MKKMGIKKVVGVIFQIPAWLLLIGSVFVGFYAWFKKINNIGFIVPLILLFIIFFYIAGRLMAKKEKEDNYAGTRETESWVQQPQNY